MELCIWLTVQNTDSGSKMAFPKLSRKAKKKEPQTRQLSVLSQNLEKRHVRRIPYEVVKEKNGKLVTIKKGSVLKSARWIIWPKEKKAWYNSLSQMDLTSPELKNNTEKLIFNMAYAEPYDPKDGKIKCSSEVERELINASFDDYSDIVAITGFELTMKHIIIMLAIAGIMLPIGLSLHSWFGIGPSTVIHWLPSSPFH